MQNIFLSKYSPEDYVDKDGGNEYPDAPKKCPFGLYCQGLFRDWERLFLELFGNPLYNK